MCDKLVQIPYSDLPQLRDLYKKDWPKHLTGYQTINNYYKWFEQDPNISDIRVYSLNGDWKDGSYLITDFNFLFINTCSDDHDKIPKLLSLVDWSKHWIIFGYVHKIYNDVNNFLQSSKHNKVTEYTPAHWFYLPAEEVLKFEINVPKGYTLKQLTEEDAVVANSVWPHRHNNSVDYLKRLIRYNPSIGVFTESNELIGWIMRSQLGTLGVLQVKEEYKRRGFGSLLVKALGKLVAEMGDDICATVMVDNTPSIEMFKKTGFQILDKLYWIDII